jgi:CRISPR-associated protein Cmr3
VSAMEWHGYRLVQEDVWFFRDGKPSVLGADHYLRSIFPPFPSTLYGLVRTQQLVEDGIDLPSLSASKWADLSDDLRRRVGEWGRTGELRLRGPWMVRDGEILLPAPLDLRLFVEHADRPEDDRVVDVLRILPTDHRRGSCNWSHALSPMSPARRVGGTWLPPQLEQEPESSEGWLVTMEGMRRWLGGGAPESGDFVSTKKLWSSEVRTGVGLDEKRRTHEEHQLYTVGFVRLKRGVSLGFELGGGTLEVGSAARFGGDNRVAGIETGPLLSSHFETPTTGAAEGSVAALITPAIFEGGAIPGSRAISGAVVPTAQLAGGWDLAHRRPKPLHRAAPAGAVYWIDHDTPAPLESWSEKSEEGFGLMLPGRRPRRNDG